MSQFYINFYCLKQRIWVHIFTPCLYVLMLLLQKFPRAFWNKISAYYMQVIKTMRNTLLRILTWNLTTCVLCKAIFPTLPTLPPFVTYGKRASSTLWPVRRGWFPASFSAVGLIWRTGHTCNIENLDFWPSNSVSKITSCKRMCKLDFFTMTHWL